MSPEPPVKPSLWRTCRVLANRTRLQILTHLFQQSPQTVSAVALSLDLPLSVASQSLRAMEARGLLAAHRMGRHVHYRINEPLLPQPRELVTALESILKPQDTSLESIFHQATAFTHPRRIEIFRCLKHKSRTLSQLHAATHISTPALSRHLEKLELRHFVVCSREGIYAATVPAGPFGQALARLAEG